jgi:hypothetical protein
MHLYFDVTHMEKRYWNCVTVKGILGEPRSEMQNILCWTILNKIPFRSRYSRMDDMKSAEDVTI